MSNTIMQVATEQVAPPESPIRAAGTIFLTPDSKALFLQRASDGDHKGEWAFPGGKIEDGETAEEAAEREASEEIGSAPKGATRIVRRLVMGPVDYTTFAREIYEPFIPQLNDEHSAFTWAPIASPPEPLHPGARLALEPLLPLEGLTELDVARKVAAGELPSPTMIRGMALFALRVTGTGLSYRGGKIDEHVWRDPSIYLNPEFLARCAGLPVLWKHTKGGYLSSTEFNARVIGAVMFAWIQGDEVWAMARVYDAEAISRMTDTQLSTSPAVFFGPADGNAVVTDDDGRKLLVEGRPYLLDHLAIVAEGVWDKGGEPTGVLNETIMRADSMAGETTDDKDRKDASCDPAAMDARKDGDEPDWKAKFDALSARMDAMEKEKADAAAKDARKDGEGAEGKDKPTETAADARKDWDEGAMDAARKDAAQARADAAALQATLAELQKTTLLQAAAIQALQSNITRPMNDADAPKFAETQNRFDKAYVALGKRAEPPMLGEQLGAYTQRLARGLQNHSPTWKGIDIARFDEAALNVAAGQIIQHAIAASSSLDMLPADELVPFTENKGGHQITTWRGRRTFIAGLKPPSRRAKIVYGGQARQTGEN